MAIDELSGILRELSSKISLVQLTFEDERRVRELVKELQSILDTGRKTGKDEARLL